MRNMLRAICTLISIASVWSVGYDQERHDLRDAHNAKILSYQFDNTGTGAYRFGFTSSDGIARREEGDILNPNTENEALVVVGSYSYTGPDGIVYRVKYTADQNGFHPIGDHIKVPAFVPWNGNQRDVDHSGRYTFSSSTASPIVPVYFSQPQRTYISGPLQPIYGASSTARPVVTAQYVSSTPRPLGSSSLAPISPVVSSTPAPETLSQDNVLTILPTRSEETVLDEHSSDPETPSVANSILEILGASDKDVSVKTVKAEEINAL